MIKVERCLIGYLGPDENGDRRILWTSTWRVHINLVFSINVFPSPFSFLRSTTRPRPPFSIKILYHLRHNVTPVYFFNGLLLTRCTTSRNLPWTAFDFVALWRLNYSTRYHSSLRAPYAENPLANRSSFDQFVFFFWHVSYSTVNINMVNYFYTL